MCQHAIEIDEAVRLHRVIELQVPLSKIEIHLESIVYSSMCMIGWIELRDGVFYQLEPIEC